MRIGFTEVDYYGQEEDGRIGVVVNKQQPNLENIVVNIVPMTYDQFWASGLNLPSDLQSRTLPDPAECESQEVS